ncbi:MAG TPA: tRNA pseudouridine(55) synthase TruB [bacterium]
MDGVLLVNKPAGLTSHDVVQLVRRKLRIRRIGHTGTLDPDAEGLLVLLIGGATKSQRECQRRDKTYEGVVRLGRQTDTGDASGAVVREAPVPSLDTAAIERAFEPFRGRLMQTPPAYSAVKVRGRPAYWWARQQRPVTLAARAVEIRELALLSFGPDTIRFRVRCSAGTYVRTLAESIAERLGTAGHLGALVRLTIGDWRLEEARTLEWIRGAEPDAVAGQVRPVEPAPHGGADA